MMAEQGYHEAGAWAGHPRWQCDTCEFDALHEDKLRDHVDKYHRIKCEPGCDFVAADAWEMQVHAAKEHQRTIIVTDAYGREQ